MKTKLTTVIVVFLFPVLVQAQFQIDKPALSIDSLKKVLPLLHDSARVDCLNELARSYTETRQSDSAFATVKQQYKEASAINYIKGLGDACFREGILWQWHHWNINEARVYYREAISWYKKIENYDGLGHAFLGLGSWSSSDEEKKALDQSAFYFRKTGNRVMLAEISDQYGYAYNAKGEFEKFFEIIKQGLREKKNIGDNRGIIWSYYRLAYIYQSVGDYETALNYFRQSYQQAASQSITWHPTRSMGDIFLHLKNYDSSLYYYHQGRWKSHAPSMASIGKLFMLRQEYDTALNYLQKAISSFEKTNNHEGIMRALVDMGKSYAGMKQYAKALQYARQCLAIARRLDAKDVIQNAYEMHWKVYEDLKQKDSAYFYYRKFVTLKDSLDDAKFKLQYLQKLSLYKVEAKEEQQQARIDLLNKDNQLKQQQLQEEVLMKKILIICLIVLVLLGIIIFRNIILKRRNEKLRLENELKEQQLANERKQAELQKRTSELQLQALRAQMNPHFIFNCLNSINRFILKNETETASDYLTKFSKLIRMVLNNSQHTYITLNDDLDCLELQIQLEQLRVKNSFRYKIKCDGDIDAEELLVPPLLLQPFVENAIWHGLMHKEGEGNLDIHLQLKNEILECTITDNGIGRKAALELDSNAAAKYKSRGLQITKDRIALLEDSIEIEDLYDENKSAGGTKVTLKIKYKTTVEKVFL